MHVDLDLDELIVKYRAANKLANSGELYIWFHLQLILLLNWDMTIFTNFKESIDLKKILKW